MMAPIAGYQALAVLWDQGEANMDEGFMLRREQCERAFHFTAQCSAPTSI
jgi:hypothetical protein